MSFIDDIDKALHAFEATAEQVATRLAELGNFGTAGPAADEHPAVVVLPAPHPAFVNGWWSRARRVDAHAGRMGPSIRAVATGLHSTDMLPDDWEALIDSWSKRPGDGACANFLLGRDERQGVVQLVPTTRNSNHMGGTGHGVFVIGGREVHPNLVTNSIEIHCAGGVRLVNGQWRLVENGAAHGAPLPAEDVIPDPARPGRGLHKITDYQRAMVKQLLADLHAAQAPLPAGTSTRAFGETPPSWSKHAGCRVVVHAEMDPVHRADPWQHGCAFVRELGL